MKVLIISPEGRHTAIGKKFKFPFPTAGAPMVAALTPPDCDVRIIDEIIEDINFDEPADLVAISSMTPMASRAYEISAEFRRRGGTSCSFWTPIIVSLRAGWPISGWPCNAGSFAPWWGRC